MSWRQPMLCSYCHSRRMYPDDFPDILYAECVDCIRSRVAPDARRRRALEERLARREADRLRLDALKARNARALRGAETAKHLIRHA